MFSTIITLTSANLCRLYQHDSEGGTMSTTPSCTDDLFQGHLQRQNSGNQQRSKHIIVPP
jgi:hypothetical protein